MHAWMKLHHHAVLDRQARHFHQHMAAKQLGVAVADGTGHDAGIKRLDLRLAEMRGEGRGMAMIGGGRPGGAEVCATPFMGTQIAGGTDRPRGVWGRSVAVRLAFGGGRSIKKKNKKTI